METYDLKGLLNGRFDTEYIYNAKTLKSMNIANFLVLGLAVGEMLFTCTMAKGNLKNKIDTFALVKKKEAKKKHMNHKEIAMILTCYRLMKVQNNYLRNH